jgi:hypothetical protein
MRRDLAIQAVVVGCVVAVTGRGTGSTTRSSATAPAASAVSQVDGRSSATGNGHIMISDRAVLERFSFSATKLPNGNIAGQWQVFKENDERLVVHGSTVCLGIDGKSARIGGEVTQTSDPVVDPVGTPVIWTVVDNGEGANDPPDQTSELIKVNSAQRAFHCATGFILPLFSEQHGNVQVHQ